MKIQFGSGANRLPGWINHDSDVDVTSRLPFGDGVADEVMAEHLCEHLSTPDFFRFLLECKRILKPGGVLWLSLPVLDRLVGDHARDIILGSEHQAAYTSDSLCRVVSLAGFSLVDVLTERPEIFGHWKQIGELLDQLESCRLRLIK